MAQGDITFATPKAISVAGIQPDEITINRTIPRLRLRLVEPATAQLFEVICQNGVSTGLRFTAGAFETFTLSTPTGFTDAFQAVRSGNFKGLVQALATAAFGGAGPTEKLLDFTGSIA